MFGARQTTRLHRAASFRLAGHHWGPLRQMYASESTSSASPESTLNTINCGESTPLRTISTVHMCYPRNQHSSLALCQVMSGFRQQNTEGELILASAKRIMNWISIKFHSDSKLELSVQCDILANSKAAKPNNSDRFTAADNVSFSKQQRGNNPNHLYKTRLIQHSQNLF